MSRTFSQITFDFSQQQEEAPVEAKKVETPAVVVVENEAISEEPVVEFTPIEKEEETQVSEKKKGNSGRGRKAVKSFAAEADLIEIPEDELLFQKHYYTIGEVSQMFKVNASLLRFWESEFDIIKPRKNRKGDRHFRPVDIKNLQLIYDLLRRRKLTIDGAKDFLKNNRRSQEKFEMIQSLKKIKSFLLEIKASL